MVFVTLEGLDNSGKSTVIEGIKYCYPKAVATAEPTDLRYGQLVRQNLSDEESEPLVDFFLFMADRRNHIEEVVTPALNNDKLVVCDRYSDSTRAYQPISLSQEEGGPFASTWESKMFIEQAMARWNKEPHLTLYIDVPVDVAIERMSDEGEREKFEHREFLERVKDNYDAIADTKERVVRIDGTLSEEEVVDEAIKQIEIVKRDQL